MFKWFLRVAVCTLGLLFGVGIFAPFSYADTSIAITEEQIFMVPVPIHNLVQIVEVLSVQNPTNQAQSVVVGLPSGYAQLSVPDVAASSLKPSASQLTIDQIAKPLTTTSITIVYSLPFKVAQALQFTLHSFYAVPTAHLYIPIGGIALSAQNLLISTQTVTISGTQFRAFSRLGIPAGDDWTISLQSLPTGTSTTSTIAGLPILGTDADSAGNTFAAVGNLLLAAFILVVGLVSIRRTEQVDTADKSEALLRAWMGLERQREAGVVDDEYMRKREDFMRKLRLLKDESKRNE